MFVEWPRLPAEAGASITLGDLKHFRIKHLEPYGHFTGDHGDDLLQEGIVDVKTVVLDKKPAVPIEVHKPIEVSKTPEPSTPSPTNGAYYGLGVEDAYALPSSDEDDDDTEPPVPISTVTYPCKPITLLPDNVEPAPTATPTSTTPIKPALSSKPSSQPPRTVRFNIPENECIFTSFGRAYGALENPPDLLFDLSDIPNPPRELRRRYTGQHAKLRKAILAGPKAAERMESIREIVDEALRDAGIAAKGRRKAEVRVGISCVRGRHRSVAIVEELSSKLTRRGWNVRAEHRDVTMSRWSEDKREWKRRKETESERKSRGAPCDIKSMVEAMTEEIDEADMS